VCGPIFIGATGSRGAANPMIHRLLTWMLLILAPEAAEGWFLAPILAGMVIGRCGWPSRCSKPTSKPWVSYGPPWAHYLGGYQDRLLGGPLGLPGLRCTAPDGVKHKDYGGEVLG
jgi:hypothetical protein